VKTHTPWWGSGDPPHEMWPGVSLTFTPEWSSARDRWETHGGRYFFDAKAAEMAERFFPLFLTHHMGEFAGEPFKLRADQSKLLTRPIFGWKRSEDGLRRIRKVFAFCPKGWEKSVGQGTGIYLARYDQELPLKSTPSPVTRSRRGSSSRTRRSWSKRRPIWNGAARCCATRSSEDDAVWLLRVISGDASTKHGFRPHGVIFDEMHAQKTRDLL
jgi:hypothetical protein